MDKNTSNNQTKIELSLAALMFFSPFVSNTIEKDDLEITPDDKSFIKGYIKLGYFLITILLIAIISGVLNYNITSDIINIIYNISIISLTTVLVVGTISILTDTHILVGNQEIIDLYYENITSNRKDTLLSYTPIYNIYLWYTQHNFISPNILIKESIIAWLIFIILGITTTPFWTSTLLIIIIIRIASLMGGIELIHPNIKKFINKLFTKNPEELRGYIRGSIIYLYEKFIHQSDKQLSYFIEIEKNEYALLYNIEYHSSRAVKSQYILLIISLIYFITQTTSNLNQRTTIIPGIIFLGRYITMFVKREHLPSLPIYKEIVDLSMYIYDNLHSHFNTSK